MRLFKTILAFIVLITLFMLLNNNQGSIPPLGKFLNPFAGFWQNGSGDDQMAEVLDVKGLREEVTIVWDERQIPHVFAQNDYDAYFTQGFLTARHRLWQMEFQTHVAAGRVSEIIGPRAIDFDKLQRRRGLLSSAESYLNLINQDPETQLIVQAYANGVNTWIATLTPASLPLEYKLLNYKPEAWSTLKTALLQKYMAWDLTGRNSEMDLSVIRHALGEDFVERYYPEDTPRTDPIIPAAKPWRFEPLMPDVAQDFFTPQFIRNMNEPQPNENNGSNNWAVSGRKTRSGSPILANDPHLGLNLPSIWYEIQLNTPDMNVYGTSLPGAPAVIIGFNEDIAWGLTNAGTDVLDWFEIEFKDSSFQEYLYLDEWIPADMRIEEILVRDGDTVQDTFPITRFGPVVHFGEHILENGNPVGLAMRWSAHDPSNEMQAIRNMNLAHDLETFYQALDQYRVPGQNFAMATKTGDIAIRHNGHFPLRAKNEGKFVQSGRDTTGEWTQWIPPEHLPVISNPWRGYVSSANQNPVGKNYPYYMGWEYDDYERGARINEVLGSLKNIDLIDMQNLHTDHMNVQARRILPFLLKQVKTEKLTNEELEVLADLKQWNYLSVPNSRAALVYREWWVRIEEAIWNDELTINGTLRKIPTRSVTENLLLRKKNLEYYDNVLTKELVEDRQMIIRQAFEQMVYDLHVGLGDYGEAWELGRARGTDINHLLSVKGLGRTSLYTGGGKGIVNATNKKFGPSWRMMVEIGDSIRALGVYPGGQSGNPGSKFYDNAVDKWVKGEYYDLHFLGSPVSIQDKKFTMTRLRNYQ
ncbi:MAG: penicillin acylase family protein [Candidatus Marinimicrobia bacterium]|nr:penicillin acylase family protein [Candidatus Neomarinimicrobiota bacterium]MCF7904009.1 penicillin acylase family protein [Candidatus Neomarinimicrobiota bacterium]